MKNDYFCVALIGFSSHLLKQTKFSGIVLITVRKRGAKLGGGEGKLCIKQHRIVHINHTQYITLCYTKLQRNFKIGIIIFFKKKNNAHDNIQHYTPVMGMEEATVYYIYIVLLL